MCDCVYNNIFLAELNQTYTHNIIFFWDYCRATACNFHFDVDHLFQIEITFHAECLQSKPLLFVWDENFSSRMSWAFIRSFVLSSYNCANTSTLVGSNTINILNVWTIFCILLHFWIEDRIITFIFFFCVFLLYFIFLCYVVFN